jgi:hypothetical protein
MGLFRHSHSVVGQFSPNFLQCLPTIGYRQNPPMSYATFGTIFRLTGGFLTNFYSKMRLTKYRKNKLCEEDYESSVSSPNPDSKFI